ncbi:YciE/YciF ferroxidase family protein [Allorhodopirellula solitaria]|uniref:Uncharacterized protein n=1 Tax=Allorhodopirellula solitaria TaxID=2527987 RepID=A0A5C5X110_9BACT|nr:ferritin-like domain-containing protein [Allorhodopirellula solitaria]TWT56490.1 hypothetical protein CA85_40210 [Allorhodopirellula solitaria]
MSLDSLADAFYDELRDVYSAEKQLTKALPKLVKNATYADLKKALKEHLAETEQQVERVEKAFEDTGKAARAKSCAAMKGLIEEAEEMLKMDAEPAVKDAVIIACGQKVEHYEIATYGTLCTWAELLGYKTATEQLKLNMAEEEAADQNLSKIAEAVNSEAMTSGNAKKK